MVDTQEFLEGQYVTADLVKNSPSKKLVIVGEAKGEDTDYGFKLTANVEIDGKQKVWRMNKDSITNMREISEDSKDWNGTTVSLRVIKISGKEIVLGVPNEA